MNESVIDIEEQIVSFFPEQETAVCGGWILKSYAKQLWVHPLYRTLDGDMDDRIGVCEKIGRYKLEKCVFRIAEYTNYYLRSRLIEENNYCFKSHATVGELNLTNKLLASITKRKQKMCIPEIPIILRNIGSSKTGVIELVMKDKETIQDMSDNKPIGRMRMDTLFLFDGNLLSDFALWNVLKFAADNRMKKIITNFAGSDSLPELYGEYGFQKSYSCYCYEKQEENKNGFAE